MTMDEGRIRRLVRHRERLEHQQEGELAVALRLHAQREGALAAAAGRREALLEDGSAAGAAQVDPQVLASGAACAVRFQRDIDSRRTALALSEDDVAAERQALMERRRDRKAMELLLERRLAEERERKEHAAAAGLDEAGANRWLARRRQDRG
jgi:flagellar export protein FliJ